MNKILLTIIFVISLSSCQKKSEGTKSPKNFPPSQLSIVFDPDEVLITGTCSKEHTVVALDVNGSPANAIVDQIIRFTSTNSEKVSFYSDPYCSNQITNLQMAAGRNSVSFYIKSEAAEHFSFTAATTNIRSDTQSHTPISSSAARIDFIGPNSVSAGECSLPFTVRTLNPNGVLSEVSESTTISLSGMNLGRFYMNSDCSGSSVSSVVVPVGESSVQFYFKTTKIGSYNLTATAPGSVKDTLFVSARAGSPAQIAFLSTPQNIEAGECSSGVSIQYQDAYGNPSPLITESVVNLEGDNVLFYSNPSCLGQPVNSISILANSSTGIFYLTSQRIEANAIRVSGLATQLQSLTVRPSVPDIIEISPIENFITAGSVFNQITINIKDRFGNVAVSGSPLTYSLAAYSNSTCSTPASTSLSGLTQLTTPGIARFSNVSYPKAETIYIGASLGDKKACSNQVTVISDFASKVLISGPTSSKSGQCSEMFTLTSVDSANNPSSVTQNTSISLSGNGAGSFYLDSNCSGTPISNVVIPSGNTTANFYFKGSQLETLVFKASGLGAGQVSHPFNVVPGDATKIVFTGPSSVTAGLCTGGFIVQSQDSNGNTSNVSEDTLISLTHSGEAQFFSDVNCLNSVSSVFINKDTSSRILFVKSNKTEQINVTASGLGTSEISFVINPSSPYKLKITTPPTSIAGQNFSGLSVEVLDQFNNRQNWAANSIAISSYLDSACSIPTNSALVGTLTKVASSGVANFTDIKYNKTENIYIKASSGSLISDCSNPIEIISGVATNITITPQNQTAIAGECSAIDIKSVDSHGNSAPTSIPSSISLMATSGFFYDSNSCDVVISETILVPESATKTIYHKGTIAGNVSIQANSLNLGGANTSLQIQPNTATKLILNGSSILTAGQCSEPFLIKMIDEFGNETVAPRNMTVQFSTDGDGSFYSDEFCSTEISSTQILLGESEKSVFFKSNKAEIISLAISAPGIDGDEISNVEVKPQSPVKIQIDGPSSIIAGTCSPSMSVSAFDDYDNLSSFSDPVELVLETQSNLLFYSDSDCLGIPSSTFTFNIGDHTKTFYVQSNTGGTVSFNAILNGYDSQVKILEVNAGPASRIGFKTDSKNVVAGLCSSGIVVAAEDSLGYETFTSTPINLTFPSNSVEFYSTPGCLGSPISNYTIPENESRVMLYVKAFQTTTTKIEVSSSFNSIEQNISVSESSPSQLVFKYVPLFGHPSDNSAIPSFSSPITVQIADEFGNLVKNAQNTVILNAYSDSQCQIVSPELIGTKNKQASQGLAEFNDLTYNNSGTIYVKATSGAFATECSGPITINSVGAFNIAILGPTQGNVGTCVGPFVVETQDFLGDTVDITNSLNVSITGLGESEIYSNSLCNSPISGDIIIEANTHSKSFWLKNFKSEDINLEALSVLGNASFGVVFNPSNPNSIIITGIDTIQAEVCSGPLTISSVDEYGNKAKVSSSESISFSNVGNLGVFSDPACLNDIGLTTIEVNTDSQTVFIKSETTGATSFDGTGSNLGSFSFPITVKNAPPARINVVSTSSAIVAGECSGPYTVKLLDSLNNDIVTDEDIQISLDSGSSGKFYLDSSCESETTALIIQNGAHSKPVWFKDTVVNHLILSFESGKVQNGGVYPVSVSPGLVESLAFNTEIPSTVLSNNVISPAFDVMFSDRFGNVVTVENEEIVISLVDENNVASDSIEGTLTKITDASGVARFDDIKVNIRGFYRFKVEGLNYSSYSRLFEVKGGVAANVSIYGGNFQAIAREKLSEPISVLVTDQFGNPTSGNVIFTVASGAGVFSENGQQTISVQSDENTGIAQSVYLTGNQIETVVINAKLDSTNIEVFFELQTISLAPIVRLSYNGQLTYIRKGTDLNIIPTGTGATSSESIIPLSSVTVGNVSSSDNFVENSVEIFSEIEPVSNLTAGSEIIDVYLSIDTANGVSPGLCHFNDSTPLFFQSWTCSLNQENEPNLFYVTSVRRDELVWGGIVATVFAVGEAASVHDIGISEEETTSVLEIKAFGSAIDISNPADFVVFNEELFFTAENENGHRKLYKTDGSSIRIVSNINNNKTDNPRNLTRVGNSYLYFIAENEFGKGKLYRYGQAGIEQILNLKGDSEISDEIFKMASNESNLYILAKIIPGEDPEISKLVKVGSSQADIMSIFTAPNLSESINDIVYVNGKLYVSAVTQSGNKNKIYEIDDLLSKEVSFSSGTNNDNPEAMIEMNGSLVFVGNNSMNKKKLFMYNPMLNETKQISNILGNSTSDEIKPLGVCDGSIYFAAKNNDSFWKLYSYNQGINSVIQISNNIESGSDFSEIKTGFCFREEFYLSMLNSDGYQKLFKTSESVLMQVSDLVQSGNDEIGEIIEYNEMLFFSAKDEIFGQNRLYRLCAEQSCN